MALFDAFTGDAYEKAAAQQRDYLGQQQQLATSAINTQLPLSLADLSAGGTAAQGAVAGATGTARGDVSGAYQPALSQLYTGAQQGSNALAFGSGAALPALASGVSGATSAWDQLLANAGGNPQTQQQLLDALGVNGPEGTARAQAAFPQSPGYQYAFEQAQKAALGGANAAGMAPGGNTLAALTQLGTNYGNQAWQQYLDNLNRQLGLQAQVGTAAAGGKAGAQLTGGTGAANIYTGTGGKLADLLSGTGVKASDITTGTGRDLATLAMQGGLTSANLYQDTAAREAAARAASTGQQIDLTKAIAGPYASTYGAEAAANTNASANIWNLGLAGLKAAGGGGYLG